MFSSSVWYRNIIVYKCTRSCTSNLLNFYDLILFRTHHGLSLVSGRHQRRAQFPHHILSACPCSRPCSWRRNLRCNLQCGRLVCCKMHFHSFFPMFFWLPSQWSIHAIFWISSTIVEDQTCDMQYLIESEVFGHQVTRLHNLSTVLRWDPWLYLHDLWCKWGHVTCDSFCFDIFRYFSIQRAFLLFLVLPGRCSHYPCRPTNLKIREGHGLLLGSWFSPHCSVPDSSPQALISPRFVGPGPQMQTMQTPQTMQMRPAMPRWERQT